MALALFLRVSNHGEHEPNHDGFGLFVMKEYLVLVGWLRILLTVAKPPKLMTASTNPKGKASEPY